MASFVDRLWSSRREHERIPAQSSLLQPDFDSFDDPEDTEHDDEHGPDEHPRARSNDRQSNIPGGYDFEPQGTEGTPDSASESPRRDRTTTATTTERNQTARFAPSALYSRWSRAIEPESNNHEARSLLFSAEEDQTDTESPAAAYPPMSQTRPLPSRPAPRAPAGTYGGGQANDGVFANLSAKPEGYARPDGTVEYVGGDDAYGDKDEVPPSYEVAALDSTPPYWETTIIAPSGFLGPDDICVDGMPVGNFFSFAWNLLVSMSFQFVGFMLTYLLHTTHAAKNGSRAGLGITLIQLGFYLKQRADHPELIELMPNEINGDGSNMGPNDPLDTSWSWWGGIAPPIETPTPTGASGSLPTQLAASLTGVLDASDPEATMSAISPNATMPTLGQIDADELIRMSANASQWMAFLFVTVGSFLLIGGILGYWRAVRWARAVRSGMAGPHNDTEARIESSTVV